MSGPFLHGNILPPGGFGHIIAEMCYPPEVTKSPLFCHPPPGPPALPHARQSRAVRVGAASATGAEPGRACHGPARLCELSVSAARAYAGMASRAGLWQLSLRRSSSGTALSQARYGASGLLEAFRFRLAPARVTPVLAAPHSPLPRPRRCSPVLVRMRQCRSPSRWRVADAMRAPQSHIAWRFSCSNLTRTYSNLRFDLGAPCRLRFRAENRPYSNLLGLTRTYLPLCRS